MARRRKLNEATIAQRISDGFGQGHGDSYRPFFTIWDFPSRGRVHRPLGRFCRRVFHLFSDLEWAALLAYESAPGVTEIREQVLLDRTHTYDLAAKLSIRHPRFGGVVWPMTTDLVVSRNETLEPVCVKYSRELLKKRVQEKVELEAEYWRSLGFALRIFTEKSLELEALRSLEVIRPFFWMTGVTNPPRHLMPALSDAWRTELRHPQPIAISVVCKALDREFGIDTGGAQAVLYHLIARGIVTTPLTPALTLKRLASDFQILEATP